LNSIKHSKIGVGKVSITPDYPIRLSGYGARKTETTEVVEPIWARCLVIIPPNQQPFILLCVENCGIPEHITETVAQRKS
jgi:neutral ceramidase